MPAHKIKKPAQKKNKKVEKVDLDFLEFMSALNLCGVVFLGVMFLFLGPSSRDISKIKDDADWGRYYAQRAEENAAEARGYAFSAKLYSKDLFEQSQKVEKKTK